MEREILEGNRLIAESPFVSDYHKKWIAKEIKTNGSIDFFIQASRYHASWDWLMPVVDKIEALGSNDRTRFNVTIETNNCFIDEYVDGMKDDGWLIEVVDAANKMDAVWQAVIEFIKWYNGNEKDVQS